MAYLGRPMSQDEAFPTTHTTWMHQQLDRGEEVRRALRSVVMARYFEPLRVYVKGSSYRGLGESAELVSAFFVSRFARDDYLEAWRASGMTLRRWLINGLILSMREEVRRRRRAARRGMNDVRDSRGPADPVTGGPDDADPVDQLESPEPDAEAAFERAWAVAILREACEEVETICNADGESDRWLLFRRHVLDGQPYALLVDETGFEPARAAVVVRTISNRVRAALRRLVERDGIHREDIDGELDRIAGMMSGPSSWP
jgi:hypothetical protein